MATAKKGKTANAASKIRILSIDGGGIRGIIPARIIVYIEEEIRRITGNEKAKIGEYFDMIAGTSTGGILACLYLAPDIPGKNKARYSAQEALNLYVRHGEKIFARDFWTRIKHYKIWNEQYPADNLQHLLDEYFGETQLSQLIRPCLITSYDFYNRRAAFFNSVDARCKHGKVKDFYVKNIARATSAAPTYFEPAKVKSMAGGVFNLIDGGVFVNNPALCAYSEARNTEFSKDEFMRKQFKEDKPDNPSAKQMYHVSIGTGSESRKIEFDEVEDAGLIGWLPKIIDIMMSGNSETVHYHLKKMYETLEAPDNHDYVRLEPSRGGAEPGMDCAYKENIAALHEAGSNFIFDHPKELTKIAEKLVEYS